MHEGLVLTMQPHCHLDGFVAQLWQASTTKQRLKVHSMRRPKLQDEEPCSVSLYRAYIEVIYRLYWGYTRDICILLA